MAVACPICCSQLDTREDILRCDDCSLHVPVDEFGVIQFGSGTPANDTRETAIEELATDVRALSSEELADPDTFWRLEQKYEAFEYDRCIDLSHFDWLSIEDFHERTVVDLGCDFGGAAVYAARSGADTVYAVDRKYSQLQFLAARTETEKIRDVYPVHADIRTLPFAPESIDICLMIGSLERVGDSIRQIQVDFLTRIHERLSDDGRLLLAVENRFAIQHFGGITSDSGGIPFTPLLPRRLTTAITPRTHDGLAHGYPHSYYGYISLVESAGFTDISVRVPLPSFERPRVVCGTSPGELSAALAEWDLSFPRSFGKRALRALDSIHLAHVFAPSYLLSAQK